MLLEKAHGVEDFDALQPLLKDMDDTRRRCSGIGLAAPQIGKSLRVVSLNPGKTAGWPHMVNPVIVKHGNNQSWSDEGCLSIQMGQPHFEVQRWDTITVWFQDARGQEHEVIARGLPARVLQHEIDHLDGILIDAKGRPARRR